MAKIITKKEEPKKEQISQYVWGLVISLLITIILALLCVPALQMKMESYRELTTRYWYFVVFIGLAIWETVYIAFLKFRNSDYNDWPMMKFNSGMIAAAVTFMLALIGPVLLVFGALAGFFNANRYVAKIIFANKGVK